MQCLKSLLRMVTPTCIYMYMYVCTCTYSVHSTEDATVIMLRNMREAVVKEDVRPVHVTLLVLFYPWYMYTCTM